MSGSVGEDPHDVVRGIEADLAALAAADLDLERDAEVAERTRIERSRLTLVDRLRAAARSGAILDVAVGGGAQHWGPVVEVGEDWLLLGHAPHASGAPGAEHLVRLPAVVAVRGLGREAAAAGDALPPRPLASVLRAWCRDRSHVRVLLVDGSTAAGLAAAAYADHLDLLAEDGSSTALPWAALAVVSRTAPG